MTKERLTRIAAWAERVAEEGNTFADAIDPRRKGKNPIANKIDGIVTQALVLSKSALLRVEEKRDE